MTLTHKSDAPSVSSVSIISITKNSQTYRQNKSYVSLKRIIRMIEAKHTYHRSQSYVSSKTGIRKFFLLIPNERTFEVISKVRRKAKMTKCQ